MALPFVLASCNDLNDFPESGIELYQQYEVYIQDTSKAGFANFYTGGPSGERFRLTGDAKVTVNDVKMLFSPSISATQPEFNYSTYIDMGDKEAVFRLRRSKNTTLTNKVNFSDIPYITLNDDVKSVATGGTLAYEVHGIMQPDDHVEVSLVPSIGGTDARIFKAVVSPFSSSFHLTDIPAGRYNIRLDVVREQATSENDGNAGGSMRVVRRKVKYEVSVTQ